MSAKSTRLARFTVRRWQATIERRKIPKVIDKSPLANMLNLNPSGQFASPLEDLQVAQANRMASGDTLSPLAQSPQVQVPSISSSGAQGIPVASQASPMQTFQAKYPLPQSITNLNLSPAQQQAQYGVRPQRSNSVHTIQNDPALAQRIAQAQAALGPQHGVASDQLATGGNLDLVTGGKPLNAKQQATRDRINARRVPARSSAPTKRGGQPQVMRSTAEAAAYGKNAAKQKAASQEVQGNQAIIQAYRQRGFIGKGIDDSTLQALADSGMHPAQLALTLERLRGDKGKSKHIPTMDELTPFMQLPTKDGKPDWSDPVKVADAVPKAMKLREKAFGNSDGAVPSFVTPDTQVADGGGQTIYHVNGQWVDEEGNPVE